MTGAFTIKGEKRYKFVKFKVGEGWPPRFTKLELQVGGVIPFPISVAEDHILDFRLRSYYDNVCQSPVRIREVVSQAATI